MQNSTSVPSNPIGVYLFSVKKLQKKWSTLRIEFSFNYKWNFLSKVAENVITENFPRISFRISWYDSGNRLSFYAKPDLLKWYNLKTFTTSWLSFSWCLWKSDLDYSRSFLILTFGPPSLICSVIISWTSLYLFILRTVFEKNLVLVQKLNFFIDFFFFTCLRTYFCRFWINPFKNWDLLALSNTAAELEQSY